MNNIFNSQILAEKLSKLNNSQQSINSLSNWCILHQKKAKQVVETWEKLFNSSQKEQRVTYLYLANDIIQNSRRKGSEFVNEFWKVLPVGVKSVYENSDDNGKSVVMRLVDIWEERKVFGSRGRGLKDDILGKTPLPSLDSNGKSSNPLKVVRKDAHSIRIKLAVGGMPEKIVTAYQTVLDEHFNEDTALNKCKAVLRDVEKMEKDVEDACTQGIQQGSSLVNEIQEHETTLKRCIEQLENVEATRAALVTQLKEALEEQESKLELIHSQLQVAHSEAQHTLHMRQRLESAAVITAPSSHIMDLGSFVSSPLNQSVASFPNPLISTPPQPQPVTTFANSLSAEEKHRSAAAAIVERLAASTSSAQMLTSVLSSLAAEEAAAMNGGGGFQAEKRPKLEKPMPVVSEMNSSSYFPPLPFPPLPPVPPPGMQQFVPYGFGGTNPPLPHARPGAQPPPPPPPSGPPPPHQQLSAAAGFYQPPRLGFFGQLQVAPPLPAPRGSTIAGQGSSA